VTNFFPAFAPALIVVFPFYLLSKMQVKRITKENLTDDILKQLVALGQQLSTSVNETLIANAIKSDQSHVLVAIENEKVIGTTTMGSLSCITGIRVHIEDVVTDSDYRGKGIASLLIRDAIDRAKNIQAKSIDLTSRPEREAANRLYKKLGFVQRDTNVYRYTNQG
jgi:ribosomal protein S18 acetylase RimI-like enzyme